MEKITLPGSLPGLLRRCSPVFALDSGMHSKTELGVVVSDVVEDEWILVSFVKNMDIFRDIDCFELDLTDPTGRHHATWWLSKNFMRHSYMDSSFGCGSKGTNRQGVEVYKYWTLSIAGYFSVRYWDRENDEMEINDKNIIVESLKEIEWENESEALRRICLHVAQERGLL